MKHVYWSASAENKIQHYKSEYYTLEETRDYIAWLMNNTENLLLNPLLTRRYTEEQGKYKGISRVVSRKFKIYYEKVDDDIIILAVKFPGEA